MVRQVDGPVNPGAGTPLILQVAEAGLDLPLKVLSWEDADAKVWLAYNDPRYIVQRFGLAAALAVNLAAVVPIIAAAAG